MELEGWLDRHEKMLQLIQKIIALIGMVIVVLLLLKYGAKCNSCSDVCRACENLTGSVCMRLENASVNMIAMP